MKRKFELWRLISVCLLVCTADSVIWRAVYSTKMGSSLDLGVEITGPFMILPLVLVFGYICARWRLSVWITSVGQIIGKVAFILILQELGMLWLDLGLVLGGSIGVFIAFRRRPPEPAEWHCSNCDYDLTGNVSGTCPECGKKIETK